MSRPVAEVAQVGQSVSHAIQNEDPHTHFLCHRMSANWVAVGSKRRNSPLILKTCFALHDDWLVFAVGCRTRAISGYGSLVASGGNVPPQCINLNGDIGPRVAPGGGGGGRSSGLN